MNTPAEATLEHVSASSTVSEPINESHPTCSFTIVGDRLIRQLAVLDKTYRSSVPILSDATNDDLGAWWKAYLMGHKPEPEAETGRQIRFAELFCGPGGLALGFTQACRELGLRPVSVAAADQDSEALSIYQRRNSTRYTTTESVSMLVDYRLRGEGDNAHFSYQPEVVDEGWEELIGTVDVLLAGPPCQGHSNLNNKTRRDDSRNELYLTVPAMALALGAKVVIIENVRAVLHDHHQVVQSSVAVLRAAGYTVEQAVLKAADMGWPQRRERFFLVAHRDVPPVPLDDVSAMLAAQPRPLWWAIEDLEYPDPADFMTRPPEFSEENKARIEYLHEKGLYDLPDTERPDCHKDGTTYGSVYGRLHRDEPAPTITTGFMTPGRGRYIHPTQKRVITAREAARIQGFPDDYDFRPKGDEIPPKAKLAKWIGDAVPMPLGYAASLSALLPDGAVSAASEN